MNNVEIIEMLNKIEEYIKHEQLESVLKYIDIKKKDLNIKKDIANEYMDDRVYGSLDAYMNEIREINSISYNRIYNGQQLIVPYYSDALR